MFFLFSLYLHCLLIAVQRPLWGKIAKTNRSELLFEFAIFSFELFMYLLQYKCLEALIFPQRSLRKNSKNKYDIWQFSDPNFHLFYLKYLIVCLWQYEIAFVTTAKLIFGSVDEQAKGGTYGKVTLGKKFRNRTLLSDFYRVGCWYVQEKLEYCLLDKKLYF